MPSLARFERRARRAAFTVAMCLLVAWAASIPASSAAAPQHPANTTSSITALQAPTTTGPSLAAPEMVAAIPEADLRGIGSDGGEGVWFSDEEFGEPYATAYLTHYSPTQSGLTRINLNTPFPQEHSYISGIAPGLHGEEWFGQSEQRLLSHITPSGKLSNKLLPPSFYPESVAVDNQGNVWFTRGNGCELGRRSPAGKLTIYNVGGQCSGLTVGPDGNIWLPVDVSSEVQELSAATGAVVTRYSIPFPFGIATLGQNIYVTETEPGVVAKITPSGQVTEYVLPEGRKLEWMTAAPDGAVWFAEYQGVNGEPAVGRLTPNGELSEVLVPGGGGVGGITATSDAIYFTQGGPTGDDGGVMRIPLSNFNPPTNVYVALGDSYSSGEGNPPYEPGTDDEGIPDLCHRSMTAAYGPHLDQALKLGPIAFKACSGAVTNDIFAASANNPTEPPQLSWLRPDTKTVTLTIGGNDAGFVHVLTACVPFPLIQAGFGCSASPQLEAETQARLNALAGGSYATTPAPQSEPIHSILSVIQAIHNAVPTAAIFFGLYPRLFGKERSHYAFNITAPGMLACEVGTGAWIDYKDAQWLNKLGKQLNTDISNAVKAAQSKGIAVTAVAPTGFVGHGFCDEHELWLNRVVLEIRHPLEVGAEVAATASSFHPTESGQLFGYEVSFANKIG